MKRFAFVGVVVALFAATAAPTSAWADEGLYAAVFLGTVETPAVTGPITVGGITYIPGEAVGGGVGMVPLGTVETPAVTGPITVGGITYIVGTGEPTGGGAGRVPGGLGTVETAAVTGPIGAGGILYIPGPGLESSIS